MPAEGQVTIVLVATVTVVDKTATAEISVKLGQAAETVVTATYTGTTTNMTAGNNAVTLKLDAEVFNVVSTERVNSPIHVGLNQSGQIRLYNSSDANNMGNILTISIAEAYKITGVEFVFGATVTKAVIMTGTTEQLNATLTANSTVTYSGLDVSQFSIQNRGTAQIYILSIKITYAAK